MVYLQEVTENEQKNNFSFVHMIGALMVVFGHQYVLMGYSAPSILGMDIHGLGFE